MTSPPCSKTSFVKLLIDTNVAIALEDANRQVTPAHAAFAKSCKQHNVTLYVADANYKDIERDPCINRRRLFKSKLNKYPRLEKVHLSKNDTLIHRFGPVSSTNDQHDVELLDIIYQNIADILVTEDVALRRRADRAKIGNQVMNISDALEWIRQTFEPSTVKLPFIEEIPAYRIDLHDPFFDSLREDYRGFDSWFRNKCIPEHRLCWIIRLDDKLAGLVIRKEEHPEATNCIGSATKIIKLCTFKIGQDFLGDKFGEHLLKEVLWWAQNNGHELIYLTVYPKHATLIDLLTSYGFQITKSLSNGEQTLERHIYHGNLPNTRNQLGPVIFNRNHYPRFYSGPNCRTFCVPIKPPYHAVLFPEISDRRQQLTIQFDRVTDRKPGNTIRKVYLCRSKNRKLKSGDLILFYMSKDLTYMNSQSITTLGVVEDITEANSHEELVRLTAKRSVFSLRQLTELVDANPTPVKVINFLLVAHFNPSIGLVELTEKGILKQPPQTIIQIHNEHGKQLHERLCDLGLAT